MSESCSAATPKIPVGKILGNLKHFEKVAPDCLPLLCNQIFCSWIYKNRNYWKSIGIQQINSSIFGINFEAMQFGKALEFDQRIHAKFGDTFGFVFVFTNLVQISNFRHYYENLAHGSSAGEKGAIRGLNSGLVKGQSSSLYSLCVRVGVGSQWELITFEVQKIISMINSQVYLLPLFS